MLVRIRGAGSRWYKDLCRLTPASQPFRFEKVTGKFLWLLSKSGAVTLGAKARMKGVFCFVSEPPYLNKSCSDCPLVNRRPPGIVTSLLASSNTKAPEARREKKGAV